MKRRVRIALGALLIGVLLIVAASLGSFQAAAQGHQSTRIVVGFPPGGTNDLLARLIAQRLSTKLGESFIVENRPGAANNIGTEMVARAQPDGRTLLMANTPNAINHSLYQKLSFNFVKDFTPIIGIMRVPAVLVANPSLDVKTLAELIDKAKASPGKFSVASPGIGTSTHLALALLDMMTGTEFVHVPYRGSPPMLNDIIGGQVMLGFDILSGSIEQIRAGKLRALAVTSAKRSPVLPDVPAVAETSPGYEASAWFGLAAPKGTPKEIVQRLNREVNVILADAKVQAQLQQLSGTMIAGTPDDFARLIDEEVAKWAKVIKFAGVKPF
jgi:tripartite-type tricarboxylate transporter receptor subunit TctC